MSSIYIKWLTFSCDLLSLYPTVHFLSMWFRGIMAIMNSRGGIATLWKIPICILFQPSFFLRLLIQPSSFFMVCSMKFMVSCDILFLYLGPFGSMWSFLYYYYYYYYYHYYSLRVLMISIPRCFFLLEFERQQVSSNLQDSSKYSGRSQ